MAVPYLDSRAIQNRLDEVIGRENWQNTYETRALMKDNAFICTISIYNADREEWVSKSNGAGSTDIEPIKGGLSDAFKRAASMWHIGRYLYNLNGVWVTMDERKGIAASELPKLEKIYIETVRKIFPKQPVPKNQNPGDEPRPVVQQTPQNPEPVQLAIQPVQRVANMPVYTVIDARFNKTHTIIELTDGKNPVFTAYFNGEAKLAKNQHITDVAVRKKESTAGDYYIMDSFQIANNQNYSQAA
jgi:hypothetical protein